MDGTYLVGDLRTLCRLRALSQEHESDREDQKERDDCLLEGSHVDDWVAFRQQLEGDPRIL